MISAFGVEHGEVSKGLRNFARKHKIITAAAGIATYNKVKNTLTGVKRVNPVTAHMNRTLPMRSEGMRRQLIAQSTPTKPKQNSLFAKYDPKPKSAEQAKTRADTSRNVALAATGTGMGNMAVDLYRRDKANPGWVFNAIAADHAKQPRPKYKLPNGAKAQAVGGMGLAGLAAGGIGYNRYNRHHQRRMSND